MSGEHFLADGCGLDSGCSPNRGRPGRRTSCVAGGGARRVGGSLRRRIARWQMMMHADRGDVPGWVLVTVMTAGLITAIWVVADDQLTAILTRAIDSVTR